MNESTFETEFNAAIKRLFPKMNPVVLEHQKTFTLKLGHHNVEKTTSRTGSLGGRLDVLVRHKNRNLVVIELKRPGIKLTDDDRDQGISYARLLPQIAPIVIVTNGDETRIYNTYTTELWETDSLDEQQIETLFQESAKLASTAQEDAVRTLIAGDADIWAQILKNQTRTAFERMIGDGFTYPLAKGFALKRSVTDNLMRELADHKPLISLTGSPYSGKTNVIYECCKLLNEEGSSFVPLYLDAAECSNGIYQYLANEFTRTMHISASTIDIRQWLQEGTHQMPERLVLIIDHFMYDGQGQVTRDLIELMQLNREGEFTIITVSDKYSYNQLMSPSSRNGLSHYAKKAIQLDLATELDKSEFELVKEVFSNQYRALFQSGSDMNRELRFPNTLRMIADSLSVKNAEKDTFYKIPSLLTIDHIRRAWFNYASDTQLKEHYIHLAEAFIESIPTADPEMKLLMNGRGLVPLTNAHEKVGNAGTDLLVREGHLQLWTPFPNLEPVVKPKITEVFAYAGAAAIYRRCNTLARSGRVDECYSVLINQSEYFPFSDKVAALVVCMMGETHSDFTFEFIRRSIVDQPVITEVKRSEKRFIFNVSNNIIKLPASFLEGGKIIDNQFPWLVLSQIACLPIEGDHDIKLGIMAKLGSYPGVYQQIDQIISEEYNGVLVHEFSDGSYLCGHAGIIESITFAMQNGFYNIPEEGMLKLAEYVCENKSKFLAHRLRMAAKEVVTSKNQGAADTARKVIDGINGLSEDFH